MVIDTQHCVENLHISGQAKGNAIKGTAQNAKTFQSRRKKLNLYERYFFLTDTVLCKQALTLLCDINVYFLSVFSLFCSTIWCTLRAVAIDVKH